MTTIGPEALWDIGHTGHLLNRLDLPLQLIIDLTETGNCLYPGGRGTSAGFAPLKASAGGRRCYGAPVTLLGTPVEQHAALPGGGSVVVWVGVPDDPYFDDKSQLTTVDIQLREGNAVVASLSTVLDPDQVSEARQLALEVKAAIEAGEIGLHASELEPFADKLR